MSSRNKKWTVRAWFFDTEDAPALLSARVLYLSILLIAFSLIAFWLLSASTENWATVWQYRATFWNGWLLTFFVSAVSLAASTLIGLILAVARRSAFLPLKSLATLYVEFVRGTPFLVQIFILFYIVAPALHLGNRILIGIMTLSLFSGAYIAEMIRAGIDGVSKSQLESARAIGLTSFQTARFVILPQALRQILPPMAGQFASLIKDSSLLSIIGISEFTFSAQQVNSATYSTLESFLPLAIGYLILTLPISLWSRWLEKKMRYET